MENVDNLARNEMMRLPPGFRFHPTDEELILQYLRRKVFSCPLPSSIIPEIDHLYNYDPWDLPGDKEEEKYFFSIQGTKCSNANHHNKTTHSGYWKATGSEKQIVACGSKQVVGMKKVFVFYIGKHPNVSKTDWMMHEYSLLDAGSRACIFTHRKNSTQNSMKQMDNWVLYRIFAKKRSTVNAETTQPRDDNDNNRVEQHGVATKGLIDFMGGQKADLGSPSLSSSSNFSCITELSSSTRSINEEKLSSSTRSINEENSSS